MRSNLFWARSIFWFSCVLVALALALSTAMFLDEEDAYGPEGLLQGFSLSGLPEDHVGTQAQEMIDSIARAEGVNVYKSWSSADQATRTDEYYIFVGDPDRVVGDLQTGTFPTFGWTYRATLHPADELETRQLPGNFSVQGTEAETAEFISRLDEIGVETDYFASPAPVARWPFFLMRTPWGAICFISLGMLSLATLNLWKVRLSIVGVRLAVGSRPTRVIVAETMSVLLPTLLSAAAPALLLLGYSVLFSGGYRWRSILEFGALYVGMLMIVAMIAGVTFAVSTRHQSTGTIIAGKRPLKLLAFTSAVLVACTVMAAGVGASDAVVRARQIALEQSADSYRDAHADLVFPNPSWAVLGNGEEKMDKALGKIFIGEEAHSAAFLSQELDPDMFPVLAQRDSPGGLVVNTTFLDSLPNVDQDLRETVNTEVRKAGGIAVLIPEGTGLDHQTFEQEFDRWLSFQHSLVPNGERVTPHVSVHEGEDLGVVPMLDYYDSVEKPMYRLNPLVIVTDSQSGLLSDRFYSYAGAFSDEESLHEQLQSEGIANRIASVEHVADVSDLYRANRDAEYVVLLSGLVIMMVMGLLAGAIFAAVYVSRNRAAIFLKRTVGGSPFRIHRRFVFNLLTLTAVPVTCALSAKTVFSGTGSWGMNLAIIGSAVVITLSGATGVLAFLSQKEQKNALEVS